MILAAQREAPTWDQPGGAPRRDERPDDIDREAHRVSRGHIELAPSSSPDVEGLNTVLEPPDKPPKPAVVIARGSCSASDGCDDDRVPIRPPPTSHFIERHCLLGLPRPYRSTRCTQRRQDTLFLQICAGNVDEVTDARLVRRADLRRRRGCGWGARPWRVVQPSVPRLPHVRERGSDRSRPQRRHRPPQPRVAHQVDHIVSNSDPDWRPGGKRSVQKVQAVPDARSEFRCWGTRLAD